MAIQVGSDAFFEFWVGCWKIVELNVKGILRHFSVGNLDKSLNFF